MYNLIHAPGQCCIASLPSLKIYIIHMKFYSCIGVLTLSALCAPASTAAAGTLFSHAAALSASDYRLINNPSFPTNDLAVATADVTEHGIDPTGATDCTAAVQRLLDELAGVGTKSGERGNYENLTGGVLYFPAGKYRFDGQLVIPRGVTIRGDWKKPDMATEASGTIFMIYPSRWEDNQDLSFITMQPCTEVSNLSFWYPEQSATDVRPAPPTVLMGQSNYWGNEYCNVRFCTFYNSYTGVKFNEVNGGGCPNIFEMYGTPLHTGIEMDRLADVGRLDHISFSPGYWSSSHLDGAPGNAEVREWLLSNATGIVMRRNDWTYTCNYEADGYAIGYRAEASPVEASYCPPNGHHYNFDLRNCMVGIDLADVSYTGIMFTRCNTSGCGTGVRLSYSGSGPAQFYGCDIEGLKAFDMTDSSAALLTLQDCAVKGVTHVNAGQFQSVNSRYASDVFISAKARCIFTGNSFSNSARLDNNSLFECEVSDIGPSCVAMPDFREEWMEIKQARPARAALYVVDGLEALHITGNLAGATDCTSAIQNALDRAGAEGGGVVYLPKGHYRLNGTLRIPSGVELKGASDLANVPHGQGTVLEVYSGRGNAEGTPFITMSGGSGLRGVTINYPEQTDGNSPLPYPYSVRGDRDCYIVNVALRAAYRGVDLFTNKCDNHYVDYLGGHAFMNVIRVGGDSKDGTVSNVQFNTIAYDCGHETKFGAWPNSTASKNSGIDAYAQNYRDLDFFIIGDCDGEILYNNFLFGCRHGLHFVSDGKSGAKNVHAVGNAVDAAVNTFVFESLGTDLALVNSQVVALDNGFEARFITAGEQMDKTVTLFASDHWGSGRHFAEIKNGTVNLYSGNMNQSGASDTFTMGGGKLNAVNTVMYSVRNFVSNPGEHEQRINMYSSVVDPVNSDRDRMGSWENNLSHTWVLAAGSATLSREGWKATAFNDVNGTNPVSKEGAGAASAIDGDASTRWDSCGSQAPGQWFEVDLGKPTTFNTLIMDDSGSPSDGPAGYTIEVYSDGAWKTVAEGKDAGSTLVVTFPEATASKIRVNQTGSKSNYWSIHEFNLAAARTEAPPVPTAAGSVTDNAPAFYLAGESLRAVMESYDNATVEIYDLSGRHVHSTEAAAVMPIDHFGKGIYVAILRIGNEINGIIKFSLN